MENFSHWDFAELFSGVDAASLMVGIDPSNFEHPKGKITPVIQRMMSDYEGALSAAVWAHEFEDGVNRKLPDPVKHPKHLYSHRMFHLTGYEIQSDRLSLKHWLQDKDKAVFENQKFSRDELARWIAVHSMPSIYKFKVEQAGHNPNGSRWPWGDHHTEYLGLLEATAKRYWVKFDPSDPSTAPTNNTVIEWLMGECKVSKSKANAIASMLRANGLPTGPR